jgi:hypothetical protein
MPRGPCFFLLNNSSFIYNTIFFSIMVLRRRLILVFSTGTVLFYTINCYKTVLYSSLELIYIASDGHGNFNCIPVLYSIYINYSVHICKYNIWYTNIQQQSFCKSTASNVKMTMFSNVNNHQTAAAHSIATVARLLQLFMHLLLQKTIHCQFKFIKISKKIQKVYVYSF